MPLGRSKLMKIHSKNIIDHCIEVLYRKLTWFISFLVVVEIPFTSNARRSDWFFTIKKKSLQDWDLHIEVVSTMFWKGTHESALLSVTWCLWTSLVRCDRSIDRPLKRWGYLPSTNGPTIAPISRESRWSSVQCHGAVWMHLPSLTQRRRDRFTN